MDLKKLSQKSALNLCKKHRKGSQFMLRILLYPYIKDKEIF